MRSIHELLILLREGVEKSRYPNDPVRMHFRGLCNVAIFLFESNIINKLEYRLLIDYIACNRPGNLEHFFTYYWPEFLIAPRLRWCSIHIKKTKIMNLSDIEKDFKEHFGFDVRETVQFRLNKVDERMNRLIKIYDKHMRYMEGEYGDIKELVDTTTSKAYNMGALDMMEYLLNKLKNKDK